jgi:hypothetical protein
MSSSIVQQLQICHDICRRILMPVLTIYYELSDLDNAPHFPRDDEARAIAGSQEISSGVTMIGKPYVRDMRFEFPSNAACEVAKVRFVLAGFKLRHARSLM